MSTRTITGKAKAWFASGAHGPEDLDLAANHVVGTVLSYSSVTSQMERHGWSLVGEVEITVTLPDRQTLVENKVESLRAQKTQLLAETQAKATAIESQIQKLLAITYEGEAS